MASNNFRILLYLSLFILSLISTSSESAHAQIVSNDFESIRVEIVNPPDSPVLITLTAVAKSPFHENLQSINFTLQNISNKRIKTYVPLLSSNSFTSGNELHTRFDFEPGKLINTGVQERGKLNPSEKLTLSIDYILFSDGSSWGRDSQRQSEFLSGNDEGEKYAIQQVRNLLKDKNKVEFFRLLKLAQEGKISDNSPDIGSQKSERWQDGFKGGYGSILVRLLPFDKAQRKYLPLNEDKELDAFLCQLNYIEKSGK